MVCNKVQELLSAYLDDELTPGETQFVRQHLDICVECTAFLDKLEEVSTLFHTAFPPVEAPGPFEVMVMSQIDKTIQEHHSFRIKAALLWNSATLLVLACVVILSPVGVFLWGIAHVMVRLLQHLYVLLFVTLLGQGWLVAGIVAAAGFSLAVWSIMAMGRLMRKLAV